MTSGGETEENGSLVWFLFPPSLFLAIALGRGRRLDSRGRNGMCLAYAGLVIWALALVLIVKLQLESRH